MAQEVSHLFPTFKEIQQGYQVFQKQGKYKGTDWYGNPIFGKSRKYEIVIAHNAYSELLNSIYYVVDAKNKPLYFKFILAGNNYAYSYSFDEQGWQACVSKIQSILTWYNKCIKNILGEQDEKVG